MIDRGRSGLTSQCELCRRWGQAAICGDCLARHAAARPRCARCGLPTGAAVASCGECLRDEPPFAAASVAVDYEHPWDHLIAQLKFRGRVELAAALAPLMAQARQRAARELPERLAAVPASRQRLRERGFNQAWELARRLQPLLGVRGRSDALLRVLDPPHQTDLTRAQRLANLRAAFTVPSAARAWLDGRRVMLVDDVMTTGATLREASAALLRAGAAAVEVLVFARTDAARASG